MNRIKLNLSKNEFDCLLAYLAGASMGQGDFNVYQRMIKMKINNVRVKSRSDALRKKSAIERRKCKEFSKQQKEDQKEINKMLNKFHLSKSLQNEIDKDVGKITTFTSEKPKKESKSIRSKPKAKRPKPRRSPSSRPAKRS